MNKTLAITAIALVAVVMGFSAVAPAIPVAYGDHLDPNSDACQKLRNALAAAQSRGISKFLPVLAAFVAEHCPE